MVGGRRKGWEKQAFIIYDVMQMMNVPHFRTKEQPASNRSFPASKHQSSGQVLMLQNHDLPT
jgi:hypothetical protein